MIKPGDIKCEICHTRLSINGGFTASQHKALINASSHQTLGNAASHQTLINAFEYLENLCFPCYEKVPEHIPRQQCKDWLSHEMQKL